MQSTHWYNLDTDEVLHQLQATADGLSQQQAEQRLQQQGENALPEGRRRSVLTMLLGQFADFMIMVLLAAALVSGVIGEPQDTIAILVIVIL
ncbi:MAG: cation-transporting P-type ATPase, partial [Gammaproteobacteria bacterium]|nr:cation-transporting P-type ATPase [Gammaproteobacteria bacterium]